MTNKEQYGKTYADILERSHTMTLSEYGTQNVTLDFVKTVYEELFVYRTYMDGPGPDAPNLVTDAHLWYVRYLYFSRTFTREHIPLILSHVVPHPALIKDQAFGSYLYYCALILGSLGTDLGELFARMSDSVVKTKVTHGVNPTTSTDRLDIESLIHAYDIAKTYTLDNVPGLVASFRDSTDPELFSVILKTKLGTFVDDVLSRYPGASYATVAEILGVRRHLAFVKAAHAQHLSSPLISEKDRIAVRSQLMGCCKEGLHAVAMYLGMKEEARLKASRDVSRRRNPSTKYRV